MRWVGVCKMSKLIKLFITLIVFTFSAIGEEFPKNNYQDKEYFPENNRIICPECDSLGIKSCVYPGMVTCTCMYCGNGFYDTLGIYHPPEKCNTCTRVYRCSNGHYFNKQEQSW